VIGPGAVAIEAKATANVHQSHLAGLRELARDHPGVGRRVVVCLEERPRRTEDEIDILPVRTFIDRLWSDALVPA